MNCSYKTNTSVGKRWEVQKKESFYFTPHSNHRCRRSPLPSSLDRALFRTLGRRPHNRDSILLSTRRGRHYRQVGRDSGRDRRQRSKWASDRSHGRRLRAHFGHFEKVCFRPILEGLNRDRPPAAVMALPTCSPLRFF